jgi:nucleotide-binding universal stress UspA family protein
MELKGSISKILLPVDTSEYSKQAVQSIAGYLGAYLNESLSGITLLHVTPEGYLNRRMGYIDFRVEDLKQSDIFKKLKNTYIEDKILPFLNEGERILKDSGINTGIEKIVLDGDPANEIVRVADEGKYSLIIMARRGLSEIKGFFLGSVTAKVIGNSPCNVLVIPPDGRGELRNILVATDGSRYSNAAASHAITFAKSCGAGLTVISVVPSESATPLDIVQSEMQRELISEKEFREAEKNVKYVKDLAEKEGLRISGIIIAGKPYEAIIDIAKTRDMDLIVIGSHGKTGIEKFFMGSVAERVIILSSCAVMVIRIPKEM